jgi:hypothetical protein
MVLLNYTLSGGHMLETAWCLAKVAVAITATALAGILLAAILLRNKL